MSPEKTDLYSHFWWNKSHNVRHINKLGASVTDRKTNMKKTILTSIFALFAISGISQNIDKKLPTEFKNLVSQKDYENIVDLCVDYFKPLPKDFKIKAGTITYSTDTTEIRHSLENLVRLIAGKTKAGTTKEIIKDFFDSQYHPQKVDVNNYKVAKERLCIRFYHESIIGDVTQWKNFIYKDDLKELKTVVVLDLPEAFEMVSKDLAKTWKVTEKEIFDVALKNTESKEVEVIENKFGNIVIYAFLSDEYSASQLPFFHNLVPKSVGKYGSLITIPTKGTVIIHPINKNDLTETFKVFKEKAMPIYNEDPGKITKKYYWFYNGKFQLVDKKGDQNIVPQALTDLLK